MTDEAEKSAPTLEEKQAYVEKLKRERREMMERAEKEEAATRPPLKLVASTPKPPTELLKRLANPEKPRRDTLMDGASVEIVEIELGRLKDSADIGEAAKASMKALVAKKARIFQRAGTLVQPVETTAFNADRGQIKVVSLIELNAVALKAVLMRQLKFFKKTDSGKRPVNPGFEIPQLILKDREVWPFHEISGLLGAPTLRPDGSLLRTEGHDRDTGLLLLNPPHVRTINPAPSKADAEAALAVLKELLVEFPFVDEASRSVALSLIISVMVRGALDQVPLHVIAAPAAGTGKSFLVDVASMIATGETAAVVAATGSAEELEKRIGAELIGGHVLISLDNINGLLSSDLLCQAVTQDSVSLRPLGSSMVEKIANRAVFCANGINIAIADELALQRTPHRRLANPVHRSQLRHRFALGVPFSGNADHLSIQLALAPERDSLGLGPLDALLTALADQTALELSDAAHDCHHQAADLGRGIAPAFPNRWVCHSNIAS
jgi:hypothetical protein